MSQHCHYWISIWTSVSPSVTVSVGVLMVLLSVPALLLNLAVIISLTASKQTFTSTPSFLMACLCATDLLGGSFTYVIMAAWLLQQYHQPGLNGGCTLEYMLLFLLPTLYTFLLCITVLMATDRFLHMKTLTIRRPWIQKIFEKPNIYILVCFCILLSLANGSLFFIDSLNPESQAVLAFTTMAFATVVLWLITILYTCGYIVISRFSQRNPVHRTLDGSYLAPPYLRSLYKSVLCLIATFIVSHTPLVIDIMSSSICRMAKACSDKIHVLQVYINFCFLSLYTSFLLDAIIILHYNETARAWLKTKMPCELLRNNGVANQRSSSAP